MALGARPKVHQLLQSACTSVPSHIWLKYCCLWRKTPINSNSLTNSKLQCVCVCVLFFCLFVCFFFLGGGVTLVIVRKSNLENTTGKVGRNWMSVIECVFIRDWGKLFSFYWEIKWHGSRVYLVNHFRHLNVTRGFHWKQKNVLLSFNS